VGEQTFTIDNKVYNLGDEDHLRVIYLKILDLGNERTLRHTLGRRPNLVDRLIELSSVEATITNDPILGTLPKEFFVKQLTRSLSFMITHQLLENKKTELSFRTATVAQNLGNMLLDTFIARHYKYVNISSYLVNEAFARDVGEPLVKSDKAGITEFARRSLVNLQIIIDALVDGK
jgi:hypothetical protein